MTYQAQIQNINSLLNSTTISSVTGGEVFQGVGEDVTKYGTASISIWSPFGESTSGTLTIEVSRDNINWGGPTRRFENTAIAQPHMWTIAEKYFRIKYEVDPAQTATSIVIQTQYSTNRPIQLAHQLDEVPIAEHEAILTKSVIMGQTDNGDYKFAPVTPEGHLEVAIHHPMLPFGSIHAERLTPAFQVDAVYGLNSQEIAGTTGMAFGTGGNTGAFYGNDGLFSVETGTTAFSFATIQSRRRLRYRAGQGMVGRFTAIWSPPAANSIVVAGFGHGESGLFFGYNGTSFGILHSTRGVREIQTLQINTPSTATNSYVLTLPNTTTVTVTASNNNNVNTTAFEIAKAVVPGWYLEQRDGSVLFLASDVGNKSGLFSISQPGAGTPVSGTCTQTVQGVSSTDTWISQSEWNGDKLDGTGSSGYRLSTDKGNVFQIGMQYLGFGSITFDVETTSALNNNSIFTTVHTLKLPNTRTLPSLSNPSMPFTIAAYSAGSTTNVSVSTASFAGFIEGDKFLTGPRMSYYRDTNGFVGSTAGVYYPLFTVRNSRVYNNRANQSVINLLSISCAHDDATPLTLYVIRNADLSGPVNFQPFANNSCSYWDTGATTCTISSNNQIIYSLQLADVAAGQHTFEDDILLQPGETVTIAARAATATAPYVNASLNTREDQ